MSMIKVFYPGPAVPEDEHKRAQNHLTLGLIVPGWNDAQDNDDTMAAVEAGLVRLDEPRGSTPKAMAKPKATTDVPSAPSAPQE